jgi:hypothetical protein
MAGVSDSVTVCDNGMSNLPTWAMWSIAVAVVLLSPVFAFLIAIGVAILVGVLYDAGMLPGLAVGVVGAIGWSMIRKMRRPRGSAAVEA